MDKGKGGNKTERFFFNPKSCLCEAFTYNGKEGNGNNFLTAEDCEETCNTWSTPGTHWLSYCDQQMFNR